jgi:hypothetical protein
MNKKISKFQIGLLIASIFPTSHSLAEEVMSLDVYQQNPHEVPYVLKLCREKGRISYAGVRHSFDPMSITVQTMLRLWKSMTPSVVLFEGGNLPPPSESFEASIRAHGEAGGLVHLAQQSGIKIASLELAFEEEIGFLLKRYSISEVIAFYSLRIVAQERRRTGKEPTEQFLVDKIFPWLSRQEQLKGEIPKSDSYQDFTQKLLPDLDDWRSVSQDWFDPLQTSTRFTNAIARYLVRIRDENMSRVLIDHVKAGRNVSRANGR